MDNYYLPTLNKIVDQFTENPTWVTINKEVLTKIANDLELNQTEFPENVPPTLPDGIESIPHYLEFEIIANAVNYCYWYGKHDIRPNDCSASKMYNALREAYKTFPSRQGVEWTITRFMTNMSLERFPLIHQRYLHLQELKTGIIGIADEIYGMKNNLENALMYLCGTLTTYSQDMLLKRASLFFMQVYRATGLFKDQINLLPIPADYQVPKMLRHLGILEYSPELKDIIWRGELIPAGSRMEIEIRASAIKACRIVSELTGYNSSQVDDWLWLNRKSCSDPFHLTITTDY